MMVRFPYIYRINPIQEEVKPERFSSMRKKLCTRELYLGTPFDRTAFQKQQKQD